jgi:HEAT repeat protein
VGHDDDGRRRRLVAIAGHRGDERTARVALDDPSPVVRATALGAMSRIGSLDPDTLRRALVDPAPEVRRRACELSVTVEAEDVVMKVIDALNDNDDMVNEAACFALGELGESAGPTAVAALSQVTQNHPDPLCREAAVAALGAIGDPAGLPAVLAATDDRPAVRRRAVLALAPFSGEEVDAALRHALTDRDWQVRQAAEDLTRPEW